MMCLLTSQEELELVVLSSVKLELRPSSLSEPKIENKKLMMLIRLLLKVNRCRLESKHKKKRKKLVLNSLKLLQKMRLRSFGSKIQQCNSSVRFTHWSRSGVSCLYKFTIAVSSKTRSKLLMPLKMTALMNTSLLPAIRPNNHQIHY